MEVARTNHHTGTVAAAKQQRKRKRSTNIIVTQICITSNLSATQSRIISTLPSPSRVHLHIATTTIEDTASPPSFPLQRRHELHLCTSNQIRDHHSSSGDVSSIAAANQNNASSNHASTHQRCEFSHCNSVLHLTSSTHRESFG